MRNHKVNTDGGIRTDSLNPVKPGRRIAGVDIIHIGIPERSAASGNQIAGGVGRAEAMTAKPGIRNSVIIDVAIIRCGGDHAGGDIQLLHEARRLAEAVAGGDSAQIANGSALSTT